MATYPDMPDTMRADRSGIARYLIDQKSLTLSQKVVQRLAMVAWLLASGGAAAWVSTFADGWLDQARASTPMTSLWFQSDNWIRAAAMIPLLAGLVVLLLDLQVVTKLTVLALTLAILMGGSAVAMRGYVMVTDDQVLIHPALPWHRDVRFALADATVLARGCRVWESRSSTHHQIIFTVRGGPGQGEVIDLGGAAAGHLRPWLTVLRDYDTGVLPLPTEAAARAEHDPDCLRYWLDGLDPQEGAELTHLLS